MLRKPSSQLHLPLLALLVLALIISIATLACAASTLRLFESQQGTNPWLLPIWRNHFDLRGLKLVVGTSATVAVLDAVCVVVLVMLAVQVSPWLFAECIMPRCISVLNTDHDFPHWQLFAVSSSTALLISAMTSLVSACLALTAATLPLVLNARAPGRDTLQSWTCGWVSQGLNTHDGMPGDFGRVCGESVSLARIIFPPPICSSLPLSGRRHRHLSKTGSITNPAWEKNNASILSTSAAHQAAEQREPLLTNVFSQRFATYAPLATLFLHLALLAVSLTALQKAKSNGSTRAVTPNSEDGEKMELEEYKNFPKEDKA